LLGKRCDCATSVPFSRSLALVAWCMHLDIHSVSLLDYAVILGALESSLNHYYHTEASGRLLVGVQTPVAVLRHEGGTSKFKGHSHKSLAHKMTNS
jgi:hypothetical protein